MKDVEKTFLSPKANIEQAVAVIQNGGIGIALVVDEKKKLLGTITDGDIRRAILNKIALTDPIQKIMDNRSSEYPQPVVAPCDTPRQEILKMMEGRVLRQIPLLDDSGRVVEVAVLSELMEKEHHLSLTAVIMAGGKGQRLRPLTKDIPKPMLPLENRPIIERIVKKLCKEGIRNIYISTNYKAEVITGHFGNGDEMDVNIKYIREEKPLGTAGALSLLPDIQEETMVINGDIITQLNFRVMYDFHKSHKADMTVGVRIYEIEIPYGVIETEDIFIQRLTEKPVQTCVVNAGIYILNDAVYDYIPKNKKFDMTDLVEELIKRNKRVVSFPIQEYWLDVGHPADYARAQDDFQNGKLK